MAVLTRQATFGATKTKHNLQCISYAPVLHTYSYVVFVEVEITWTCWHACRPFFIGLFSITLVCGHDGLIFNVWYSDLGLNLIS